MPETTSGKYVKSEKLQEAREHVKAAGSSMRKGLQEMFPKGFVEHRQAARKEMLLAMRSLLDAAIERLEKRSSAAK
jgi:ribosomal protein S19E (S16A)